MLNQLEQGAAEIKLIHCPLCGYELSGHESHCSECGSELDYGILNSGQYKQGIRKTRSFCLFGIIGWAISGLAVWGLGVFLFIFNNGWSGSSLSGMQVALAGMLAMVLVSPVLWNLHRWRKHAQWNLYSKAIENGFGEAKCSTRELIFATPGILMGGAIAFLAIIQIASKIVY